MTEPGQQTEDLRQIRPPALPADEAGTQRFGWRCLTAGVTLAVLTVLACLTTAILAGTGVWTDPDTHMFGVLGIAAAIATAGTLVTIGGIERLLRPVRARQRQQAVEVDRIRLRVEHLTQHNLERFDRIVAALEPITGRLDRFAERVDQGGKGYLDRLEKVEDAIATIADHLPDAMLSQHWRGFNEAVREGFTDKRNGTDGTGRSRPRLGLAREPEDK